MNITVRRCDLCLTSVTGEITEKKQGVHITNKLELHKINLCAGEAVFIAEAERAVRRLPFQRRFKGMQSSAWGYLCRILLTEGIFGCDVIFRACP